MSDQGGTQRTSQVTQPKLQIGLGRVPQKHRGTGTCSCTANSIPKAPELRRFLVLLGLPAEEA